MNRLWNDIDFLEGCVIAVCLLMMLAGGIGMVYL